LKARLEKDSICFNLLKNDVPMQDIPVFMRVDNEAEWQRVQLPYREKINPALRQYHFKHTLITKDIHLNELNPAVEIKGGIERDSLKVWLENPHKLAIAWFIYQGGVLLERGSGNEFEFSTKIDDHTQNYYAEVLYSFGGEDKIRQRVFEFRENYLDISLDVPDKVYPGQEVNALVSVKDQHGNPVKGVDLLAMATTSKLDYSLPSLPYYGSTSLPRSMAVHYSKTDKNNLEATFGLDYEKWKRLPASTPCCTTSLFIQKPGASSIVPELSTAPSLHRL
ncbi:MAG TPA: hypothetical protein VHO68_15485, partial [Bacteroidales bacterium]|nr:hypothetical protein [Bacteroidales bacterium]